MTTRRERALARAILGHVAAGGDAPVEVVAKARELATPTPLEEERIRKAAEKRERKRARRGERPE